MPENWQPSLSEANTLVHLYRVFTRQDSQPVPQHKVRLWKYSSSNWLATRTCMFRPVKLPAHFETTTHGMKFENDKSKAKWRRCKPKVIYTVNCTRLTSPLQASDFDLMCHVSLATWAPELHSSKAVRKNHCLSVFWGINRQQFHQTTASLDLCECEKAAFSHEVVQGLNEQWDGRN